MLRTELVDAALLELLYDLQTKEPLTHFSLGGGTALTLQIGHRYSTDLDFFPRRPILEDRLKRFLSQTYKGQVRFSSTGALPSSDLVHSFIKDKKVDWLSFSEKNIEEPIKSDGIKLLSLKDISAFKIHAIVNKRNKAKDYFDIYSLLGFMSMSEILKNYKVKFNLSDVNDAKKSLLDFSGIARAEWSEIRFTGDAVCENDVKENLKDCIMRHNGF
jgi:predicted nucleotidyltransferase component of viral defense system